MSRGRRAASDPFDEFYAEEYPRLVAVVALVTGDRGAATEAVDEAMARAWDQLRRGREIDCLPAWVRVVAMNVARKSFRRLAMERSAYARLDLSESSGVPAPEWAGLSPDLQRALDALPRRQREVIVLHYVCDLTVPTIAAELRVCAGTVKTSLSRARTALSRALAEHGLADDFVGVLHGRR